MSPNRTFVQVVLDGDADVRQAEEFVAQWHATPNGGSLAEFLGLTDSEYALWVERDSALPFILASRRFNCSLESVLRFEPGTAVAARSADADEARAVLDWLKRTGRVPR